MREGLWVYNGKREEENVKQERVTKRKHDNSDTRVGGAKDCPPSWILDCAVVPNWLQLCLSIVPFVMDTERFGFLLL